MICLLCSRGTGYFGDAGAVYWDSDGNYGSVVLDLGPLIRLSICDECLKLNLNKMKRVVPEACITCLKKLPSTTLSNISLEELDNGS